MNANTKKRGRAMLRVFGQTPGADGKLTGAPVEVRFAFPYLFEKRTKTAAGDTLENPRNDILVMAPKTAAQAGDCQNYRLLVGMLNEAAVDMWGSWPTGYSPKIQDGDVPHRPKPKPGAATLTEEQIIERNKWRRGYWIVEASMAPNSSPKVSVLQGSDPVEIPAQVIAGVEQFKSGDYGYIGINAYTFESKGNWGINFGFEQVMFSRQGERIGGGSGPRSAQEMFGSIMPAPQAGPAPQPQQYAPAPAPQPQYAPSPPMAPQQYAQPAPVPQQYAPPVAPTMPMPPAAPVAPVPGGVGLPPLPR